MGNFVYVDTNQAGFEETLNNGVAESLGLAISSSGAARMTIKNQATELRENKVCEISYVYEEEKQEEAPGDDVAMEGNDQIVSSQAEKEDDEMMNLNRTDWRTIRFDSNVVIRKSRLLQPGMKVEFTY